MSDDQFTFTPEERGFENVKDDDSDALYATDGSRDATGRVASERFAARGSEQAGFYAQKIQRDESGKIVGKQTIGRRRDDREEAVDAIETRVRNRTAPGFGGFEIGEFNVGDDNNISLARRAHLARPEQAQASDAGKRAPVTTNASRYASQPGELDYPGVDTPSTDPNVLPKDLRQRQRPATTDPPERQAASGTRTFDRGRVFSNTTKTEAVERGVSPQPNQGLQPVETAGVTGTGGFEGDKMGGEGVTDAGGARSGNVPQGFVDNLAGGREADLAFTEAESERGGDGRQEFDLPAWTLSRGRTYLNEKVYGEDREDLDPLRERVSDVSPTSEEPLELTLDEYDTFQRVVREGAEDELDALEGQEANLFGDADQQREAAREARQGIINNPPMIGGER
jgi:hypothetical protein